MYIALGTGCTPLLQCLSTQPSTLRRTVKWVSASGLSDNNQRRWWMWMVAAYQRTQSQPKLIDLVWFEGWRPPGVQSAFIKSNELSQWLCCDDSTINIITGIINCIATTILPLVLLLPTTTTTNYFKWHYLGMHDGPKNLSLREQSGLQLSAIRGLLNISL